MKPGAERMQRLSGNFFDGLNRRLADLQAAGCDVIRLDIGSPDQPPAPHILAALSQSAALPGSHGYQPHRGTRSLQEAWSAYYRRTHGVPLDPEKEVVPLLGSKEGIFHLTLACVNPGDIVLVPDPGYLTYTQAARFAGAQVYPLPLLPERGFLPDLQAVPEEIARRARLLWLNYPNNPTAAVAGLDFFSAAVDFARRWGILVCHDAAYTQVTFDGYRAPSLLEVPDCKEVAVEFNTLSKTYNMAGWRVGAALGNPEALQALYRLKTHADSGHFLPILQAATVALNGDQEWLLARNETYRRRRDLALDGLRALDLQPTTPVASLYIWCPVPPGWTSQAFAASVLEGACVSLTPGTVFGAQGEGYVRLSLTACEERMSAAMQRMAKWMGK